jgi:hypothetical protein
MPTTAYSTHFARELDVEQLAALLRGTQPSELKSDTDVEPHWRDWIRSDVQCSSCGKFGAQIVRATKAQGTLKSIRQAHFRFVDQDGIDAHHPCCEFYGDDSAAAPQTDSLVDFGSAKTQETRQIRELVCKGIEQKIFDQPTIRAMRQWFFDRKASSRFRVTASSEAIDWVWRLQSHPSYRRWPFHAVHAELPAFDWEQATIHQFTEENLALFELVRGAPYGADHRRKAHALADKYRDQEMFNVTTLKPYYEAALALCTFIAKNTGMKLGNTKPEDYRFKGAPTHLLALCALLLFVSSWDTNAAIAKFAKLCAAPAPTDASLGNVVGLNPFHDYASWHLVILSGEVAAKSSNGFDYLAQLEVIQTLLREQHRLWKIDNP